MLIGSAVTLAIIKINKKLGIKKKNLNTVNKTGNVTFLHNCSECSADCMLRNAPTTYIKNNQDLCKKIELKSNKF
jgi:hypothetical protein